MQSVSAGSPADFAHAHQQARLAGHNRSFSSPARLQGADVLQKSRLMFKASSDSATTGDADKPTPSVLDTPKPRTRLDVLKRLSTQYFTKGGMIFDLVAGTVLGALFAIGTPVMAVTIPTTLAVFFSLHLIAGAVSVCRDPNGEYINGLYKAFDEHEKRLNSLFQQDSTIPRVGSAVDGLGDTN